VLAPASAAREHTRQASHPNNLKTDSTERTGDRALPFAEFRYSASEAAGFAS